MTVSNSKNGEQESPKSELARGCCDSGEAVSLPSFARETLPVQRLEDISRWDDEAVLVGLKAECAELRALESSYPAKYHRLGEFILEGNKRRGDREIREMLRAEGISRTVAYRAEQIARRYTLEQVVQFPSVRAIVRTIPAKQPRQRKEPELREAAVSPERHAENPPSTSSAERPPSVGKRVREDAEGTVRNSSFTVAELDMVASCVRNIVSAIGTNPKPSTILLIVSQVKGMFKAMGSKWDRLHGALEETIGSATDDAALPSHVSFSSDISEDDYVEIYE